MTDTSPECKIEKCTQEDKCLIAAKCLGEQPSAPPTQPEPVELGTDNIAAVFERVQLEDNIKTLRHTIGLLNQALQCAYCPTCGETIGEREWVINDDDHLVHMGCEK